MVRKRKWNSPLGRSGGVELTAAGSGGVEEWNSLQLGVEEWRSLQLGVATRQREVRRFLNRG